MGLVGIEAVLSAIVTKLQTDMPAKLAALNALYADAYVLEVIAPESYYTDEPDVLAPMFSFPAIVLIDDGHGPQLGSSNPELQVVDYAVVVDFLVRGEDATDISKRLRRYTRAAKEILLARHSLAPTCTMCEWEATNGTRLTNRDSGDYLQDMASRFLVTTAERTT